MGISAGDRPFIYFMGESVKVRRYTVAAIFDARLEELDKGLIFCNIENTRGLVGWNENQYSSLEILIKSTKGRAATAELIEDIIIDEDDSFIDAQVATPEEIFPHLFDWLSLLDFNVMIVISLMMVVAGFNMISGLLIILFEKISMIGILKSLGMRDSSIHKIFLYRALIIVLKGMAGGNIAAIILLLIQKVFKIIPLDPENYFVTHVPVDLNFFKIIILDIVALAVIAAILYIPSVFISGVEPDKSLRQK
jgi:lipoprotein-releasing system permease protein